MPRDTLPNEFKPRFLDSLDGRTQAARELRRRLDELQTDLGGEGRLSYARRSLCRRAIWLESFIETCESETALGGQPNVGVQLQALNTLVGLYRSLGLDRVAAEVSDLSTWIEKKESKQ